MVNIQGEISIMTEQLPISIGLSSELIEKFGNIKSLSNKLEAQFNFQTLTAGWYGDEENIIAIELVLQTPEDFAWQQAQKHRGKYHSFADDVFSYHNQDENRFTCYIAITGSGFGGNDKTHKEKQGQANHESNKASGPGFAALHWPKSSSRRNSLRRSLTNLTVIKQSAGMSLRL